MKSKSRVNQTPSVTPTEQQVKPLPRFKNSSFDISAGHLETLSEVFKTRNPVPALAIIQDASKGSYGGSAKPEAVDAALNMALQQLAELQPESYMESMLLAQIIQVNNAAGICMHRAFHKDQSLRGIELYANLAIKFQRNFVAQMEALQKLRGKGGQRVTVEHVTVQQGGQAIVGTVNHETGGGRGKGGN